MDPTQVIEMLHLGMKIANRAVVSDIETACPVVDMGDGRRWYDTRPMLDPREHAPQFLDMATEILQWAETRALVQRHSEQPHLLRIVPLPHEG